MIEVGMMVMVRDPYIRQDYHVPPAKVLEVKSDSVLFGKSYLLEFENGSKEWFESWELKTQ